MMVWIRHTLTEESRMIDEGKLELSDSVQQQLDDDYSILARMVE